MDSRVNQREILKIRHFGAAETETAVDIKERSQILLGKAGDARNELKRRAEAQCIALLETEGITRSVGIVLFTYTFEKYSWDGTSMYPVQCCP